jgi:hypothetical protein
MGATVDWYNSSEKIIYWQFDREWTWEEYHACAAQVKQMFLSKMGQPIDIIMDLTRNRIFPNDLANNLRKAQELEDPNHNYMMVIVGNDVVNGVVRLARTFNRQLASHYYSARSVESAVQLIQAKRSGMDNHSHASE